MTSSIGSTIASLPRCASGRRSTRACFSRSTTLALAMGRTYAVSRFERGRYVTGRTRGRPHRRSHQAQRILEAVEEWVLDPDRMRALGFCAGVAHAEFMAEQFNAAGPPACRCTGGTDRRATSRVRRTARGVASFRPFSRSTSSTRASTFPRSTRLCCFDPPRARRCSCSSSDVGFDGPRASRVLTVWTLSVKPTRTTDFDIRYRALIGGTRRQIERAIEHGFPLMPPGCAIRLDEIAQQIVLENLRSAIRSTRRPWSMTFEGCQQRQNCRGS